jgi:diguanylate cyclase (GGDEF)-like protein
MVDETKLSSVLSEFASTVATDFSIGSILDHLVGRIVTILPVSSAGVTLIEAERDPRYVAASDPDALRFEKLQTSLGEGPCVQAFTTGEAVAVADLTGESRFPQFAPAATAAGLAAVFAFPLHHGRLRLGALDLYRETPGVLDAEAMRAAQTLADVTAAYILNARAREEAHDSSDQMRHLATHDALTGLPNRMLLLQRIDHAAQRALRSRASTAVLFVDLDRFKRVNDTYGHEAGDELLRAVALRLSRLVRPGDTLARVYGDEFVLLCEDLHTPADIDALAERVRLAFTTPFRIDGADVSVSASVGVSFAGPGDRISDAMVAEADRAMYDIKRSGAGVVVSEGRDGSPSRAKSIALGRDLRVALSRRGLGVAYQPIVRNADGGIAAVEALLRWTHPDEGPVPALTAVAVAERTGVIGEVGAWVLERACHDRASWLLAHPGTTLDLAVNVSPHQLVAPSFVEEVRSCLDRTGMPPESLILEVTETVLIEDPERARTVLLALKALGIRVALDDFGTGYSSLSYLHQLPIDIVKIDREFISTSGGTTKGAAIIAAISSLSHALGLSVVIEGVETAEHRTSAVEVGADFAQGYYYARPVASPEIARLLAAAPAPATPPTLPLQDTGQGLATSR